MKARTLLAGRLYFGIDPLRLRAATGRTLARVVGLAPERARITVSNVCNDFAVDTQQGTVLVNEFVKEGLLEPATEARLGYRLTPEFLELAQARVVDPLPRARAKQLLTEACALAERINADDVHNPLVIDAFAVYGEYMSRAHHLENLALGILVDLRPPSRRTRFGRMLQKQEGARAIRAAFKALSSFMHVRLVTDLRTLPRPFSLVFDVRDQR